MARKTKPTDEKKEDKHSHWNSKFSREKRDEVMKLIQRDVSVESACAYCKISKSTFYDRMDKDPFLLEDYQYNKNFLDVACNNVIADHIINKKSIEDARKRKKVRDRRYADKQEITWDWIKWPPTVVNIIVWKQNV